VSVLFDDGMFRSAFLTATFLGVLAYWSRPRPWAAQRLGHYAPVVWVGVGTVMVTALQEVFVRLGVEWSSAWLLGLVGAALGWRLAVPRQAIRRDELGDRDESGG